MTQNIDFEGKQILVTGGLGFIGSHIVDASLQQGGNVRVIDDMSNGSKENLQHHSANRKLEIIKADIRTRSAVQKAMKGVEIIFHQAARVSVAYSLENPVLVNDVNSNGTATILDEARRNDVGAVVVASSSSVYGDTPKLPKVESMPTHPLSPYASSKLASESMTVAFYESYGMNAIALRYFNIYGPRQRGGDYAGVISIFIRSALTGKTLPIDGDGLQSRDFTYIADVVNANLLATASSKAAGNIYNIGSGERVTILDLARLVKELTQGSSGIKHRPPRPGDVRHSLADISAAKRDLGYEPKTTLSEGLRKTIEWMKRVTPSG